MDYQHFLFFKTLLEMSNEYFQYFTLLTWPICLIFVGQIWPAGHYLNSLALANESIEH